MISLDFIGRDDDRLLTLAPSNDDAELLLITQKGTIVRQRLSAITQQGRATTGDKLQKLDPDGLVAYIHTYIHTYIHACMHTYVHTYIGVKLQKLDPDDLVASVAMVPATEEESEEEEACEDED